MKIRVMFCVMVAVCSVALAASDWQASEKSARALMREGKYPEALAAFEGIVADQEVPVTARYDALA